jgi:hypothetical protein
MAIQNKDELVQELIAVVQQKKDNIKKIQKPEWKTNCVFYDRNGKMVNIRTISSVDKAAELVCDLVITKGAHEVAAKLLNINLEFKYSGYSFDNWINDFKNICGQINIKEMLADLENDENTLNKLVSKEKREELELLALQAKLKS